MKITVISNSDVSSQANKVMMKRWAAKNSNEVPVKVNYLQMLQRLQKVIWLKNLQQRSKKNITFSCFIPNNCFCTKRSTLFLFKWPSKTNKKKNVNKCRPLGDLSAGDLNASWATLELIKQFKSCFSFFVCFLF